MAKKPSPAATAASSYRKLLAAKAVSADTVHNVTLPSGAVWKLKEPPLQQYIVAGKLPSSLLRRFAAAASRDGKKNDTAELINSLSPDELIGTMEFVRDLLLHCAIEPKIVLEPTDDDDGIAPHEIDPHDFEFLTAWIMNGGRSGETLRTFRS